MTPDPAMDPRRPMKSIADQVPPEIARQIYPDRRKNEAAYWAVRDQLLEWYRGLTPHYKSLESSTCPLNTYKIIYYETFGIHGIESGRSSKLP